MSRIHKMCPRRRCVAARAELTQLKLANQLLESLLANKDLDLSLYKANNPPRPPPKRKAGATEVAAAGVTVVAAAAATTVPPPRLPMSYADKRNLGQDIQKLYATDLPPVLLVIGVDLKGGGEFNLDLERYDAATLWRLKDAVRDAKRTRDKALSDVGNMRQVVNPETFARVMNGVVLATCDTAQIVSVASTLKRARCVQDIAFMRRNMNSEDYDLATRGVDLESCDAGTLDKVASALQGLMRKRQRIAAAERAVVANPPS